MRNMRLRRWMLCAAAGAVSFCAWAAAPAAASAAAKSKTPPPLEIAGWVPYWRTATGTADAISHMDTFKEISPFGYAVKNNGTLVDQMRLDEETWQYLMEVAREKKVKVIPTVMWGNGDAIHNVLKSPKLRNAHIAAIVKEIKTWGFDGIDIDYEGKKADTRQYFSVFLRDLYKAVGKKYVSCTIEARTPLADRFSVIPKDIRYANDFGAINKYCDRVRIMAYDQGTIDVALNKAVPGPYMPVADPKWVEKAVRLAMKTIAKNKIFIGVPTYGYESEITPISGDRYAYDILWSFNPRYATELAAKVGATPQRNAAGEMSFLYTPSPDASGKNAEQGAPSNNQDLALAAAVLPATGSAAAGTSPASPTPPRRLVWWSDAAAIRDKVILARKLGVRGVAIFKIDGGEDPLMWDALR